MEQQPSLAKSQRDDEKWRSAKLRGDGIDLFIELHIPVPYQIKRDEVKKQITQKLRQEIDGLRELVESSNGSVKVYYDLERGVRMAERKKINENTNQTIWFYLE